MQQQYGVWTTWAGIVPWWYTVVPKKLAKHQRLLLYTVTDFFSFNILLRTLFQPWKRDQLSTERLSFGERFQIIALNLVSRFFGMLMRLMAVLAGVIALLGLFLLYIFLWLSWVLGPLLGFFLIALGVVTMMGAFG